MTNKANLVKTMSDFYTNVINEDIDELLPITYSLTTQPKMAANYKFKKILDKYTNKKQITWICKPGENANRGRGIRIFDNL